MPSFPPHPEKDLQPGVDVRAAQSTTTSININQQNRLHPYYLIYVGEDGEIITNHMEVKKLLDLLARGLQRPRRACPRSLPYLQPRHRMTGAKCSAYSSLLNDAIRSMIDLKDERDLDSLFSGQKTTALVDTIAGLDDFELIAFVVVQEEGDMSAFFEYPRAAAFGRVVPKTKIYAHANAASKLRKRFRRSGRSDRLAIQARAGDDQSRSHHGGHRDSDIPDRIARRRSGRGSVLRAIDRAISFPIIFELSHNGKRKAIAAYKRPSEADSAKWVVSEYFGTRMEI